MNSSYAYPRPQEQQNDHGFQHNYGTHGRTSKTENLKERIGDFLGHSGKDLPLYKDKPHYPVGRRRWSVTRWLPQGHWKRRALLGTMVVVLLWLLGVFSTSGKDENTASSSDSKGQGSLGSWFGRKEIDWNARRNRVRNAFVVSWDDYARHAWGTDEYSPVSKKGQMLLSPVGSFGRGPNPMGWIIVDALDTAMMMNLTSRVAQAREWIDGSLNFAKADGEVNTFETTIRVLGGLLSAHYLSTTFPSLAAQTDDDKGAKGEDLYIEKAVDLADRILGAFDTPSGIPLSSFNPNTSLGVASHDSLGVASTAEAATLQLEFKYLAKATGEPLYWDRAQEIMQMIDANRREAGLVPIFIDPRSGKFSGNNIRLGSRGDSYYEYLIKQFLQTGNREQVYSDMWDEALEGMKHHLITFTENGNFTILGERPSGLNGELSPKMDHLVCFLPGTIALGVTGGETVAQAKKRLGSGWGARQEENLVLAEELMKTCWGMYAVTPTGLAAEITYLVPDKEPRRWQGHEDVNWKQPRSPVTFTSEDAKNDKFPDWKKDFDIHAMDVHNLQRPETVESLFYMWRITRDEKYREWGWQMFQAFEEYTAIRDVQGRPTAYTSLNSVMKKGDMGFAGRQVHSPRDNMEGFWLAETLKYLYLLFSDEKMITDEWFDISKVVINTEAHFFPRFDIAERNIFSTGWTRENNPTVSELLAQKIKAHEQATAGDRREGQAAHSDSDQA